MRTEREKGRRNGKGGEREIREERNSQPPVLEGYKS